MKNNSDFVPSKVIKVKRKNSNLEFVPNKVSVLRKKQRLMKSQLEPDANEIQRFVRKR